MRELLVPVTILFFIVPFVCKGQSAPAVPEGFGVELGIGTNVLYWSGGNLRIPGVSPEDRTSLFITPAARVNYTIPLSQTVSVRAFTGYHQFGGRSTEDEYIFHAWNMGTFLLLAWQQWSAGIGGKLNKVLNVSYQQSEYEADRTTLFTPWASALGFRTGRTFSSWELNGELWLGLYDLSDGAFSSATIRENHARLMIGYAF